MAKMAILQEVDKCVRCNGCVISCKRTWQMKGETTRDVPHDKLAANQRVIIKSQRRVDMGPFVRFSCWHCENPPCAKRCPFSAIQKNTDTGAVWINPNLCDPTSPLCTRQCKTDCQRGGVPMIDAGCDQVPFTGPKAWKCTMCTGSYTGAPYGGAGHEDNGADLPTKAPNVDGHYFSQLKNVDGVPYSVVEVPELKHQPACVFTCPAKAMIYDTKANIEAYLKDSGHGWNVDAAPLGMGSMYWASKKFLLSSPKADPFMEDHIAPMISSLLSSPFAKAALAPTLVVGGLLALSARRAKMEEEVSLTGGEL